MPHTPLVLTKLRVPSLRPRIVPRTRLLERLGPEPDAGLVLVSAPAGYGKTTLLALWAEPSLKRGAAVAWYALDSNDDSPSLFASYLVAALSQALGPMPALLPVEQLLRSSPETDLQSVLPAVINAVVGSDRDCLLVLDDYHLISSPAIHSAIAFLLERLPENMRVIIGSRSDPPLPLARLRARGQLAEIRASDLRFSLDETAQFLNEAMRLGLSPDLVATLEARTEGWITGLQLAALSLTGRSDHAAFISSLAGSNRYVVEYLLQEVVERQPDEVRKFLFYTSVLERMCGPLCDAVLADHSGSAAILERLEQANLFVVPLDEQGYWYRYHRLFRNFLSAHLGKTQPEVVAPLHRSASEWYASQGLLREAVRHALETRDWAYAADVVERHGMATLMHSEISTVYEWCAALPEPVMLARPMICILQAWTLVLGYRTENRSKIEERLRQAEKAADALEDKQRGRWLAGQAAVVRAFLGLAPNPAADPHEELALAQRALELLPPDDPLRSTTTLTIGYAHMALHDANTAHRVMEEAKQLSLVGHNYYGAVEATFHQARLAHKQGQLRRAVEICQQGQARISAVLADPEKELPAIGCLDIALGSVRFEQNKLVEAERALVHGLELVGWTINPYYQLIGCLALYRLRQAQGRSAEALEFLTRLEGIWPDIGFCAEASRVAHSLRTKPESQEGLDGAAAWCEAFSSVGIEGVAPPGIGPFGAAEAYYQARVNWAHAQIALGKPQAALAYLEPALCQAESSRLTDRAIELSLTAALAWQAQGEDQCVFQALERALALGKPEGYLRSFDQGPVLSGLLVEAARRGMARDYIGQIVGAIGSSPSTAADQVDNRVISGIAARRGEISVEALSDREREVLRLVARGASNQEIAEQLVLTVGTVKSHVNHILVKMGVHNRTEAVARAQELGLLRI